MSRYSTSAKRVTNKGAPDFKITKSGLILGYVENKAIDENLNKVLKSEQIEKYKSLSTNIVVTDYLDFIWINKYGPPQRARLCHVDVCRVVSGSWQHVLAIDLPPDDSFISNRTKERGFIFPIFIGGQENLGSAF